ncbi:hypothetical protein BDY21DRAFT_373563 [Lineolata rhizophorae]|uniref:Uncharacterized protein n=1 Tax=Lineolata rhizophorae TaxID=578093 RepID=A0A6A6NU31_9PEZI|nr:hypothetical protein BDY21DRAFT_373563 [Lineolata rhizophorae]
MPAEAAGIVLGLRSHSQLFDTPPLETYTDGIVELVPFGRHVFRSSVPFGDADLLHWLWLLGNGATDKWYLAPETLAMKEINLLASAGIDTVDKIKPIRIACPARLELPRVVAGPALLCSQFASEDRSWLASRMCTPRVAVFCANDRSYISDEEVTGSEDEEKWSEKRQSKRSSKSAKRPAEPTLPIRARSSQQSTRKHSITYLTVVQTLQENISFPHGFITDNSPGASIFKVVRSGSREVAASTSFYEAGHAGWSTVFACAVREDDVQWLSRVGKDMIERVHSAAELERAETDGCTKKLKVFF